MKKMCRSKMRFIFIPIVGIAVLFLVSYLVMQLWNHTLPDILGTQAITYWQAMGLFFLCKLLFGFGGGGPRRNGPPWKRRALCNRFDNLSKSDKESIQRCMQERRGHWRKPDLRSDENNNAENPQP